MTILTDWNLTLDVDAVFRGQGADPGILRARRPGLVSIAEEALAAAQPLIAPRVTYRAWDVEGLRHEKIYLAGGRTLSGPLVIELLAAAHQVIAVLCTVGDEIDAEVARLMPEDPPLALAFDGVGSAAAEALGMAVCAYFEQRAAEKGWQATLPLSPGMNGWPTDVGQQQLFALLDPDEVNVQLLPSSLMIPRKSVSFLLGIGPDVSTAGETCDYCELEKTCRYRRKRNGASH